MADARPMPWATGPSGQGSARCGWCDRMIYAPALPCSVEPPPGLLGMELLPGFGRRCQYELSTRRPGALAELRAARIEAAPRPYPPDGDEPRGG